MIFQAYRSVLPHILLILVAAVTPDPKPGNTAVEQLHSLQSKLHSSHVQGDWHANLENANQLKALLNEAPNSLLEVARARVHLKDFEGAWNNLEQYIRMGQASDLLTTLSDFSPLRTQARFAKIESGLRSNRSPISLGALAFQLPDPTFLAEDVDYEAATRRFYFTGVRGKKIISVDGSGSIRDFAQAPDSWPLLAIKIDSVHGLLWATEVAIQGFSLTPQSDWGRSALLCFDLKNGALMHRIEGPSGSALGDMVLAANGDVIVSDGDGGGVYRLQAKTLEWQRLDSGDFISPQTPVLHPDGRHIFIPDYERGIGLLDMADKRVRWLAMRGKFALNGIDGLYFDRGRLIAVENGTSPERVVAFALDSTLARVTSEKVIERATDTLGDPTHGVIVGNDFYYIANSGWDVLDDHGEIKQGTKLSPARMMRFSLQ